MNLKYSLLVGLIFIPFQGFAQENRNNSPLVDLGGTAFIDRSVEVTGPVQADKYFETVKVSTPSTPRTNHAKLFLNTNRQLCSVFDNGLVNCFALSTSSSPISAIVAGLGLTGGGTSGTVTLYLSTPITSSYIPDYISGSSVTTNYLGVSSATATYLQLSSATANYLKLSSATATYLQLSSATATYLQISSASVTYAYRNLFPVSLSTSVVGNLPVTNLNSGTNADSSHFWRGDGQWISSSTFSGGGVSLSSTNTWTAQQTFTSVTASSVTTTQMYISSGIPKILFNNTDSGGDQPYILGGTSGASGDGVLHLSGGFNRGVKIDYNQGSRGIFVQAGGAGVIIQGSNTNDTAATGDYGEYISSKTASLTSYGLTNVWSDCVSTAIAAGDWDMSLVVYAEGNTTGTQMGAGISTTSGNSSTGLVTGDNEVFGPSCSATANASQTIPSYRVSLSGTTTYYGKVLASYSVTTPKFMCRLSARRLR